MWYQITLPVNDQLPMQAEQLTAEFDALFWAAGCPPGMALFAARADAGHVAFYLSPTAARFADEIVRQFSGATCGRPNAAEVELVEGDPRDRRRLCG